MRSALFLVLFTFIVVPLAKADQINTMNVSFNGQGETGSENVTGTFQFDATTGTASNFFLQGTGLVSEHWAFGPLVGTLGGAGIAYSAYYFFNVSSEIGSQGDGLPPAFIVNASGGFFFVNGEGIGPNLGGLDSWGGGTITPAPDASTWMLFLGAALVALVIKRRALRIGLSNSADSPVGQ